MEKYFLKIKPSREEKDNIVAIKKSIKKALDKNERKKAQSLQQEMASIQLKQMQKSFSLKVILFRMLPYSMFLGFIRSSYKIYGIILNIGFIHFQWLGTYILFSVINSIIFNKILNSIFHKNT